MSRNWVALSAFFVCSVGMIGVGQAGNAPATAADADFQNEIRLSCEKYAKEDRIPPKEVKEYVALCIRDFSEAQPTDEFPPFESEEGIMGGPPNGAYVPLEKSMEMEKAHPIDPPVVPRSAAPAASPTGKPSVPSAAPATKPAGPAGAAAPATAKPAVPPVTGKESK
ncbi:MAG: hypothetical protein HQL80_00250 [Magnetococcales bacterium]|nr:hypothetical protein [Magnetococcales bacterium]